MEYSRPVTELIKDRVSVRTYNEGKIESEKLDRIKEYLGKVQNHSSTKDRYELFNMEDRSEKDTKLIWKPNIIKGARYCIIGISNRKAVSEISFGYDFEKIILFLTDLGLSTCWLGGAYNREGLEELLSLGEDEFVSIISPIGYEERQFRVMPGAMNMAFRARKRKPWKSLFYLDGPKGFLSKEEAEDYREPLEMVRLGPSGFNRQPWRVVKQGQQFHFFIGIRSTYNFLPHDMGKIEIGIAKCHFELSAKEKGLKGFWEEVNQEEIGFSLPRKWKYHVTWVSET